MIGLARALLVQLAPIWWPVPAGLAAWWCWTRHVGPWLRWHREAAADAAAIQRAADRSTADARARRDLEDQWLADGDVQAMLRALPRVPTQRRTGGGS